ncbi:unnamed protein product [Mytilus coruscus]|uniref:B box-type domain-containing protein n=1 Tax=Mytilus coruscus TaxID=42192 RepID=A0A6J8CVU7_MYTCO|nr:unnamed protein product [Mytilus coruscus]
MDSMHPEQCDLCFTLRYDTYCSKCTRHLCNACNHGHACKDEAGLIADAGKQKDSYKVNRRKNPCIIKYVCDEHKSEYNRFCGTCGDVICQDCCSNIHVEHDIESIPTAWTKCAAIVRSLLTNLNHDIETAVKLVTDLHDIISETEKKNKYKITGVYAVSGVASREPSLGTVSASVNVSTSGTTRIHKLFTKHPQQEEPRTSKNINAIVEQKSLMFQFEQAMEEKESIRQRFIEMAGRTLSSIAIGSARSRDVEYDEQAMPKQIIEMFGKLYEEEWRQALDQLSITGRWQAHIFIKHLFLVDQRHKAEMKQVREFRKSTSTMCAVNLQKMIVDKPEFQANLLKWDEKDYDLLSEILNTQYFNRCVYLSWLMVVQNPPMYIDEGPVRRSYINRDVYQEFTKRGSIIDYCVWPALYVEKGAPLGTKGIVQVY